MVKSTGIHHITAIVGHPQENVDFYAEVLGLRMIKKTVNFDDPETYHLYFGNDKGDPGTAMTFFSWPHAPRGKVGSGQVRVTRFAIPVGAIDFWLERLTRFGVDVAKETRFDEPYLAFSDPHGLMLELVESDREPLSRYETREVEQSVAIKGFYGAVLESLAPEKTARLLEKVFGLTRIQDDESFMRFQGEGAFGHTIDLIKRARTQGVMGVGTVHHIAFRNADDKAQGVFRERVMNEGYRVTPVIDRMYFHSIYFRDFGGILFEMATDGPGFTVDEPYETLGEALKLPPQHEHMRPSLNQSLIPIDATKHRGELR